VNKSYHNENQSKKQIDEPAERVAVLRSAHGREGNTFCTSASFIYSSTGAKLLAGRSITARAANTLTRNAEAHERGQVVRQFPPRPRSTSPTNTRREAA
jgi:hypothetical protein